MGLNKKNMLGGTTVKLATAAQMKEIDRIAMEERKISSTLLMERAAKAVVKEVLALPYPRKSRMSDTVWVMKDGQEPTAQEQEIFFKRRQRSAVVFCGPGNNGGDGVAAARFLLEKGWMVKCVLVGARKNMSPDCKEMERRLKNVGGSLEEFQPERWYEYSEGDVAIDALFGVGLDSDLRGDAIEAVRFMQSAQWVVSVDVPSGIHADTGEIMGHAVQADVTVTFSMGKPGLFVGKGAVCSGKVVVADIGIPADLLQDGCGVTVMEQPVLKKRQRDAHKGDFGKLFILAGSRGYTGAPVLASRAAVRSGAGLVTLAVPEEIYPIIAVKCDEAMPWPLPEDYESILKKASECDAALIGPGLGQSEQMEDLVLRLLKDLKCPVILDADGLNILSRHIDILDKREAVTILTPHDREFSRLSGCALPIVDRLKAAREFAAQHQCIMVLKGYRTITAAWSKKCVVNTTGNPGMARGGSGDALAGLMAGLLVQCKSEDTIAKAVWLHGFAGDLAAADKGEYGMGVGDIIEQIPYAMKKCEEE